MRVASAHFAWLCSLSKSHCRVCSIRRRDAISNPRNNYGGLVSERNRWWVQHAGLEQALRLSASDLGGYVATKELKDVAEPSSEVCVGYA